MKRVVAAFLVMAVLVLSGATGAAAPAVGSTVGNTMPTFTLAALDGQKITVTPAEKVIVLNFWATWCPPCRQEMPELNSFYLQRQNDLEFYAINLREDPAKVNNFMMQQGYAMFTLVDADGSVGTLFRTRAIPTTIVVDRNGVIQLRHEGMISKEYLEAVVKPLL